MSFLSNLIKKAAPIVATVAPGTPIGTAAAAVTYAQAKQEQSYQRKLAEQRQKEELYWNTIIAGEATKETLRKLGESEPVIT